MLIVDCSVTVFATQKIQENKVVVVKVSPTNQEFELTAEKPSVSIELFCVEESMRYTLFIVFFYMLSYVRKKVISKEEDR